MGYEQTVLAYQNGEEVALPGVQVVRTPHIFRLRDASKPGPSVMKLCADVALFVRASKFLRGNNYDLLVAIDIEGAVIAAFLKKRFRLPTIIQVHGIFSELLRNNTKILHHFTSGLCDIIEKFAWKNANQLVCIWPFLTQRAKLIAPSVHSETIIDTPPPTALKIMSSPFPATAEGHKWKNFFELNNVVLYAGNLASYQNLDLALKGMQCALDMGLTDTKMVVIGGGYEQYAQYAFENGLKDHVYFLGMRSIEETADLIRLANVCLTLNAGDGNPPSKIIYYFLAGRPILACDSTANRQLLSDRNATFCSNAPMHFATTLISLLSDKERMRELADASRQNAQEFKTSTYTTKWENVIAGLYNRQIGVR